MWEKNRTILPTSFPVSCTSVFFTCIFQKKSVQGIQENTVIKVPFCTGCAPHTKHTWTIHPWLLGLYWWSVHLPPSADAENMERIVFTRYIYEM